VFCAQCGKPLSTGALYCAYCGAAVSGAAVTPKEQPASQSLAPGEASPSASSPKAASGRFKLPKWLRSLAIILLVVLLTKLFEQFSEGFKEALHAADNFFKHGVQQVAPFHLCAVFYRTIMDGLSSSSQPGNANLGTIIALAIGAAFQTLGTIFKEGAASILTAAIVLFLGIVFTFDRKADHPFLTTLFLAPVVGGCFLYALLLFMLLLSAIFGAGAATIAYVGTTFPLVKACASVVFETSQHKVAERVVDRLAKKFE
jgi:zinc ribbon protein